MSSRPPPTLVAAGLTLLLAGNALAWMPYGEPPPQYFPAWPGPPGYGQPGYEPMNPPAPPASASPSQASPEPATAPTGTPATAPEQAAGQPRPGTLRQQRTDAAYTLDIAIGGPLTAEQISVEPTGRGLLIRIGQTAEQRREQRFEDPHRWQRSWTWSSGTQVRRLPVPEDGDLSAMTRADGPDAVHIVIPRRPVPAAPRAGTQPGPAPAATIPPETQP